MQIGTVVDADRGLNPRLGVEEGIVGGLGGERRRQGRGVLEDGAPERNLLAPGDGG